MRRYPERPARCTVVLTQQSAVQGDRRSPGVAHRNIARRYFYRYIYDLYKLFVAACKSCSHPAGCHVTDVSKSAAMSRSSSSRSDSFLNSESGMHRPVCTSSFPPCAMLIKSIIMPKPVLRRFLPIPMLVADTYLTSIPLPSYVNPMHSIIHPFTSPSHPHPPVP